MGHTPKITVVVTAYNIEKYLETCLESIANQSYNNCEVLVIDDGSTDLTGEIALEFCKRKGYRYMRQNNAGVSVARNMGIRYATGEFVAFVDGDDYLDNNALFELIKQVDNDTDIVCSCCHAFTEGLMYDDHFYDKSYNMKSIKEKERLFIQLMNGNYGKPYGKGSTAIGVPWGKLYRRSLLDRFTLRFDPNLRRMQDNVFNMHAFYYARKVIYYDKALYNYRLDHIQSKNTKYEPLIWLRVLEAREGFFQKHQEVFDGVIRETCIYEKYVGLAASVLYIAKEMNYKDAVISIENIRKNPVLKSVFDCNERNGIPKKFLIIKLLIVLKLYPVLILALKII